MDDRQRQLAQFASALNQYAGTGERVSRERSAPDGRSSTGSTSSGSSSSSNNAAAAALWGDLGRALSFNYSGWPPTHQGGSDLHRYGIYSGFNEGSENRSAMEGRSEGRRVPSKGETKATPPLPHGLASGMGSALASLQQLVRLPNDEVYRTLIAQQQYAAAAALSVLPSNHPSISPIPPSSHSNLSPNQLHSSAPSRQQQIDKHIQQQLQMSRQRQQSKSPSPLPLLATVSGSSRSSAVSPESNLNGEYLESLGRGQSSQLSPMTSRKERLLEQFSADTFQGIRPSSNPTPPKSTSISPVDGLTSHFPERDHYNVYGEEKQADVNMRVSDLGARSGSESEGDQRVRPHKRKQDQPKRQSVIYSNALPHQMSGVPQQYVSSSVSADSSSDDSQGYDSIIPQPPVNESIRNSSPLIPLPPSSVNVPSSVSQAMNHALSHPFLAAHLNNSFMDHSKQTKEIDAPYNTIEKYSEQYGSGKINTYYKDPKSNTSYYANEKEISSNALDPAMEALHYEMKINNPPQQTSTPQYDNKHPFFRDGNKRHLITREMRQYTNENNDLYYPNSPIENTCQNVYSDNEMCRSRSTDKEQNSSNSNLECSNSFSEQSENENMEYSQRRETSSISNKNQYQGGNIQTELDRNLYNNSVPEQMPSRSSNSMTLDKQNESVDANRQIGEDNTSANFEKDEVNNKYYETSSASGEAHMSTNKNSKESSVSDIEKGEHCSNKLVNGSLDSGASDDGKEKNLENKDISEKKKGNESKTTELYNGDHDHINSHSKKTKKRHESEILNAEALSPEYSENKRPTRQKRPVSYVEDETDPVLETNEDLTPMLSPTRKRGRRSKDKTDSGQFSEESNLTSPQREARTLVDKSYISHSNSSSGIRTHERQFSGELYYNNRFIDGVHIPSNINEPLHIDTSNNYDKSGQASNASIICSPDIYDFNEIDGDGKLNGPRNKRGRKRGSPRKPGGSELIPLSPKSNKSPKQLYTNSLESEGLPLSNDSNDLPYVGIPGRLIESDILKTSLPPPPLLPNSSSIVDEVEMQLAALHKEHLADAENRRRLNNTPDKVSSTSGNEQKNEKVVHKPLLSVVPLEQLTYEGVRNKNEKCLHQEDLTMGNIVKDSLNFQQMSNDLNLLANNQNLISSKESLGNFDEGDLPSSSMVSESENNLLYNENFDSESNKIIVGKTNMTKGKSCAADKEQTSEIFSKESHSSTNKNVADGMSREKGLSSNVTQHLLENVSYHPPNVHVVSVAHVPLPSVGPGRSNRGNRIRKRGRRRRYSYSERTSLSRSETNNVSDENNINNQSLSSDESLPKLRRNRRNASAKVEGGASPTTSPPPLTHDTSGSSSNGRVPDPNNQINSHSNEAETIEDIAKFLEDTAQTSTPKFSKSTSESSKGKISQSTNSSNTNNTNYKDVRPKRISRPPPEMNEGEMNDLLLLLNMEDGSDDEDYVPKEDKHNSSQEESSFESEEQADSPVKKTPAVSKSSSVKRKKENNLNKVKIMKESIEGNIVKPKYDLDLAKRKDSYKNYKKKWEEKFDGRGPIIKILKKEGTEVVINAPDREDDDDDSNKKLSVPFYIETKSGKVGYYSTLHNNYDAFNKDLNWYCGFCKNYSHYRTLGDLFGPFFVKGLNLTKKNFPDINEGQVTQVALSPTPENSNAASRPKNKKTPRHDSTDSSCDAKKELGNCSPPLRFVPTATPARMLGRVPMSPRIPVNPPKKASNKASTSDSKEEVPEQNNPAGTECWLHEACIYWSYGVTVVNSKLCGLEEAIIAAQDSTCSHCGETGATVCCLEKGCSKIVHVPCARLLFWTLDTSTFRSFCPKHSVSKDCTYKGKSTKKS